MVLLVSHLGLADIHFKDRHLLFLYRPFFRKLDIKDSRQSLTLSERCLEARSGLRKALLSLSHRLIWLLKVCQRNSLVGRICADFTLPSKCLWAIIPTYNLAFVTKISTVFQYKRIFTTPEAIKLCNIMVGILAGYGCWAVMGSALMCVALMCVSVINF